MKCQGQGGAERDVERSRVGVWGEGVGMAGGGWWDWWMEGTSGREGVSSKGWRQSGKKGAREEGQMVEGLARSPLYPRHFAHAQREFRLWRRSALLTHMDGREGI